MRLLRDGAPLLPEAALQAQGVRVRVLQQFGEGDVFTRGRLHSTSIIHANIFSPLTHCIDKRPGVPVLRYLNGLRS